MQLKNAQLKLLNPIFPQVRHSHSRQLGNSGPSTGSAGRLNKNDHIANNGPLGD